MQGVHGKEVGSEEGGRERGRGAEADAPSLLPNIAKAGRPPSGPAPASSSPPPSPWQGPDAQASRILQRWQACSGPGTARGWMSHVPSALKYPFEGLDSADLRQKHEVQTITPIHFPSPSLSFLSRQTSSLPPCPPPLPQPSLPCSPLKLAGLQRAPNAAKPLRLGGEGGGRLRTSASPSPASPARVPQPRVGPVPLRILGLEERRRLPSNGGAGTAGAAS